MATATAPHSSLAVRALNRLGLQTPAQVRGIAEEAARKAAIGMAKSMSNRGYSFAAVNRLNADWNPSGLSGDAEMRGPVRRMIFRARDLAHENDYVRGFLADCESNVIGAAEFDLRSDVADILPGGVKRADDLANRLIETAWAEWNRPENASCSGDIDWRGIKRLALRDVPTTGAVLFRHIRGAQAKNRFGYTVQLLEVEQLDLERHVNLPNGNRVRFGIEKTAGGRTVAFWLYREHPGNDIPAAALRAGNMIERIDAADIGILQVPERISQTLAHTWFVSAGKSLKMLDGYEDAELVAARAGACKGGFFTSKPADGGPGYPTAAEGQQLQVDAEPGVWEALPPGVEPVIHDPTHPNTAFAEFRKAVLRRIATALGVSYTTLGNDLEAVNFSSARVGLMDEREMWKSLQLWFRVHFLEPVFKEWLTMAISVGAINLPIAKFAKFNQPRFKPRRWDWLEPLKDVQARTMEVEKGFNSRRAIIDERGGDVEQVFADQEADNKLAEKHGLEFPTDVQEKPDPSADPGSQDEAA